MRNSIITAKNEEYIAVYKRDVILGILALFLFWVVLSCDFSYFSLAIGLLVSVVIIIATRRLVITEVKERRKTFKEYFFAIEHLVGIVFITVSRVIYGNILLFYQAITLKISPRIVKVKVRLGSDLELALLSGLITLTPGTIVIDTEETEDGYSYLYIHFSRWVGKEPEKEITKSIEKLDGMIGALFK